MLKQNDKAMNDWNNDRSDDREERDMFDHDFEREPEEETKQLNDMESYQSLISELLGNDLTPKAQYERLQNLIQISKRMNGIRMQGEYDLNWYGSASMAYQVAKHYYGMALGTEEPCEEALYNKIETTSIKELFECLNPNKI